MYKFKSYRVLSLIIGIAMMPFFVYSQETPTHIYNKMVYGYDDAGNRISRSLEVTETKVMPERGESKDSVSADTSQRKAEELLAKVAQLQVKPRVYPNPSSNYLIIDLLYNSNMLNPSKTVITIRDAKGASWYQGNTEKMRETIDMSILAMGKYFLTVQSEHYSYIYTVIKN